MMASLEPPTDHPEIIKSSDTADKVIKTKVALENFYTNLLAQHSDRQNRLVDTFRVLGIAQPAYRMSTSAYYSFSARTGRDFASSH